MADAKTTYREARADVLQPSPFAGPAEMRAKKMNVLAYGVDALASRMDALAARVDADDLMPGIPGDFVAFMAKKFGNDWVVGRATENMRSRYENVISRGTYEKAIAEYNKQTGRRHY